MTDDSDFYFAQVDDRPASIYVDLGAVREVPLEHLPFMAYVRLHMRTPRDDGLSSQEEFDRLIEIEDQLTARLLNEGCVYLGRYTGNGLRDFFFYVGDETLWNERVAAVLEAFPEYEYESGTQEDPEWSTYFDFLFPPAEDQQRISNRRLCAVLESNGDTLETPREIDHWFYLPDEARGEALIAEAATLGFTVRDRGWTEDEEAYRVQLWREDIPQPGTIDELTLALLALALSFDGDYDGWETVLVTDEPTTLH